MSACRASHLFTGARPPGFWPFAATLALLLTGCDSSAPTASSDAADASVYPSKGNFQCHEGRPYQAVQITASAEVAPGASVPVSVQTPPQVPVGVTPERMYVFCQVDGLRCVGTSCNGKPPVDFIGHNGDGLTWTSNTSTKGDSKTVFTAIAHNSDPQNAHEVTLTLDLAAAPN